MLLPICQDEFVTYTRCLNKIKVIEQCCRKKQLSRTGFLEGRFFKILENEQSIGTCSTFLDRFSPNGLPRLQKKINFINSVHSKLKEGRLKERSSDDCTPLAAEFYNTSLKTILAWNEAFKDVDLYIHLPTEKSTKLDPSFTTKTIAQIRDEKALVRYFELLDKHPKLKRKSELNDYTKGTSQIIYDPVEILKFRQHAYQKLYDKAKSQGSTHFQADELATNFTRPGVVFEDHFHLWIRDVVISPQGYKHTYNRFVWQSDLERIGGAAALPVIKVDGVHKIIVQVAFRHPTGSWEFEMPRGLSEVNETGSETAKREILEETGYVIDDLNFLGNITPDSGLTASIVPIFLGEVIAEKEVKRDKTEAIKQRYAFTLAELMEGFNRGYIEVELNENICQVPIRDPFLAYALLMAQYNNLLT